MSVMMCSDGDAMCDGANLLSKFGSGTKQYSTHHENRKIGSFYSGIVILHAKRTYGE